MFGNWNDKIKVRVWDRTTDKSVLTFDAGKRSINRPVLSTDGRFLAAGDWDGHARVYDLASGKLLREFDTKPPTSRRTKPTSYTRSRSHRTAGPWRRATRAARSGCGNWRPVASGSGSAVTVATFCRWRSPRTERSWRPEAATGRSSRGTPRNCPSRSRRSTDRRTRPMPGRDSPTGMRRSVSRRSAISAPGRSMRCRCSRSTSAGRGCGPKGRADAIEKLGSEEFADREAGAKALSAAGEGAVNQLRAASAASESAEVRQRIARLVAPFGGVELMGDRLRTARAVEATERAGTADAKKLLREWAGGARGAMLTEAARSALARLGVDR